MLFLVIIPRKFLSDFSLKFTGRFDPMSMETERFMEEQRKFNPKPTRKQFEESPGWTWGKVAKGVGESVLVVGWFIYLCLFDSERFGVRRMFISLCYLSFRRGKQLYTPKKMAAKWWKFCKIHSVFGRSWRFGWEFFKLHLTQTIFSQKALLLTNLFLGGKGYGLQWILNHHQLQWKRLAVLMSTSWLQPCEWTQLQMVPVFFRKRKWQVTTMYLIGFLCAFRTLWTLFGIP